jgi:hypothetical protein
LLSRAQDRKLPMTFRQPAPAQTGAPEGLGNRGEKSSELTPAWNRRER